ncbi:helix-turn-helix domain-containing protein [Carboxydocella sp. ULO1]|uniref:helix-turn-helix domain-containing protein n=1 Tax=Carboxydocella sp. ULO1 TaxID=1926599 RepID=UPI0009AF1A3C|nr:helix-turn-helix transcriptional regulator [Carboxydocella sp. ULO1]GAW28558.1 transcriptional regulator [Carboxydocella sp. ULO1]
MNIAARITQLRQEKGYSTTKLAKLAGIAQSTLREIELGNTSPTWDTIQKLCKALEISELSLLAPVSSAPADSLPPEIGDLLEEAKDLTPEQVEALTEFIRRMKGD